MSAHTPGPWWVDPANTADVCADGTEIASAFERGHVGDHWIIQGPITVDTKTAEANARLIAAAPELLAFAQAYLSDYQSEDGLYSAKHYARMAQEVIAKATGEQP